MLEVVAACIRDGERFLICQRPEGKNCALGWEFPGGKVEAGESKAEALIRECREELDVTLRVGGELAQVIHDYPGFSIRLSLLEAHVEAETPTALEHKAIRWVSAKELDGYSFCPADQKLLQKLGLR